MSLVVPSLRVRRAPDDAARQLVSRLGRHLLVGLGGTIIVAGVVIAPLPGPMGVPVITAGLVIVLRNSFKARRRFVRMHRAHPRVMSPIRKLMRRRVFRR